MLYGHVPFITGVMGTSKALNIDRFWGCEISFPPELDDYFQVRYIKRGAEPVESLKQQIREKLMEYIPSARKVIREGFAKHEAAARRETSIFEQAEHAMADISRSLPVGIRARNMTPDVEDRLLDLAAKESLDAKRPLLQEQKEAEREKKAALRSKPYSVELVSFPKTFLFETIHTPKSLIIQLNTGHPFYERIMKPLTKASDSAERSLKDKKLWDALLMLLFAYAKAESMFDEEKNPLWEQLRAQWGVVLGAAIEDLYRDSENR